MDEKITSRENAKIKYACRLSSSAAFRRSEGRFLAEGRKLCPELARGAQLETLFYTESAMAKCPELAGLPRGWVRGAPPIALRPDLAHAPGVNSRPGVR